MLSITFLNDFKEVSNPFLYKTIYQKFSKEISCNLKNLGFFSLCSFIFPLSFPIFFPLFWFVSTIFFPVGGVLSFSFYERHCFIIFSALDCQLLPVQSVFRIILSAGAETTLKYYHHISILTFKFYFLLFFSREYQVLREFQEFLQFS